MVFFQEYNRFYERVQHQCEKYRSIVNNSWKIFEVLIPILQYFKNNINIHLHCFMKHKSTTSNSAILNSLQLQVFIIHKLSIYILIFRKFPISLIVVFCNESLHNVFLLQNLLTVFNHY